MLEKLKTLDLDRIDIDDAMELLTFGQMILPTYAVCDMVAPEWLVDGVDSLKNHISARRKDELARTLKKLEAEAAGDMSAEERRNARAARIAQVRAKLGQ